MLVVRTHKHQPRRMLVTRCILCARVALAPARAGTCRDSVLNSACPVIQSSGVGAGRAGGRRPGCRSFNSANRARARAMGMRHGHIRARSSPCVLGCLVSAPRDIESTAFGTANCACLVFRAWLIVGLCAWLVAGIQQSQGAHGHRHRLAADICVRAEPEEVQALPCVEARGYFECVG